MDIQGLLKQFGLEDKELTVYMALLEVGESALVPIAKRAVMPPMTVKYILEKLRDKDFLSIVKKNTRFLYIPYSPQKLLAILRKKRDVIDQEIKHVEENLPELNRHLSFGVFAPKVRFFGHYEIRKIYEEILDEPIDEILWIGDVEKIESVVGDAYLKQWIRRRIAKKIKTRVIRVLSGEVNDPTYNTKTGFLRKIYHTPDGFESPSHIIIYGDHVAIITTKKEAFGVIITSREFAITMKSCFREVQKNSRLK
jgi:sugar-specific transcriptional regulator TrmB